MKNITKKIYWVSGLLALLLTGQLQAAGVMTGMTSFAEPNGAFAGILSAEVTGTAGNYRSTFTLSMDSDLDGSSSLIRDITLSSWQLGAGTSTGATAGGSTTGDPALTLVSGFFGNDARFDFTGLAEGTTSSTFWFDFADLDLLGDSIDFGISDYNNLVASPFTLTLTPVHPVPLPAALWLFGSGLLGLAGFIRSRKIR